MTSWRRRQTHAVAVPVRCVCVCVCVCVRVSVRVLFAIYRGVSLLFFPIVRARALFVCCLVFFGFPPIVARLHPFSFTPISVSTASWWV